MGPAVLGAASPLLVTVVAVAPSSWAGASREPSMTVTQQGTSIYFHHRRVGRPWWMLCACPMTTVLPHPTFVPHCIHHSVLPRRNETFVSREPGQSHNKCEESLDNAWNAKATLECFSAVRGAEGIVCRELSRLRVGLHAPHLTPPVSPERTGLEGSQWENPRGEALKSALSLIPTHQKDKSKPER